MFRNQAGDSGSMNIEQLNNVAMNVVEGVCSIVSRPVELILRPWHGTRYYQPPVIFFSTALMIFLPAFSALTTDIAQMIPGVGVHSPIGIFSLGSLAKLYFLLSFIHGIRLWRRMLHMEREMISDFEGPPLPFFQLFPKSESFWFTRIVLEPAFVFVTATVLGRIFIFQSGLTIYLQIAAPMLAMKEFIAWYRSWEYLRAMLDMRVMSPIIGKMIENRATEDELNAIHLAAFPKNLSPEMREAALRHIARVISPEATNTPTAAQ
jgi:hypothetical protein